MESISAADLEKFCYCPLSWHLSREGQVRSDALDEGVRRHEDLAGDLQEIVGRERKVTRYEKAVVWISALSTALALLGAFLFSGPDVALRGRLLSILALLWTILAVVILYRSTRDKDRQAEKRHEQWAAMLAILAMVAALNAVPIFGVTAEQAILYEAGALVLLMGACLALCLSITSGARAERLRSDTDVYGKVVYVGEGEGGDGVLRSRQTELTGRPDFVLEREEGFVPVEVKTGRTPRGPLFSHIVQVAAYCYLLEEQGRKVPYGILRYSNAEHEIEFDENLRSVLLSKLEEMRACQRGAAVHRNHGREGKCRSCSRREMCPERLV